MKPIIYFLIIFLVQLYSCAKKGTKTKTSVSITILDDVTDKRLVHPNANTIYALLGLEEDKNKTVYIKMHPITDLVINNTIEIQLPNSKETEKQNKFEDDYHREKVIKNFYQTIQTTMEKYQSTITDTTRAYTECYQSIVDELKAIQKRNCTENYVVIYSELIEHSSIFSSYHNGKLKQIDTTVINKAFNYGRDLPKELHNLTVVFIFQPRQREEDKAFLQFFSVYKSYFESRGASVILKSNNLQNNIL
jgi:hypothetical protein